MVPLKILFISLTFPCKVLLFGFRIRGMTFHISSCDLWLQNAFVKYFCCIYFFLICFLLSSMHPQAALYLNVFLYFWSAAISRSFIHGAGRGVRFVRYKGAWRSIHFRMISIKVISLSSTLLKLYTIENCSCLKLSMYF